MTLAILDELAALFRETGAAHHQAFAAKGGDDPDWPAWYAAYVAPRLEDALGRRFDLSTLASDLRRLDAAHRGGENREPWPEFYARWFLNGPT